jgi:hypothetical protein
VVSVHGTREDARLHRMLDKRKPFASVFPFDDKSGVGAFDWTTSIAFLQRVTVGAGAYPLPGKAGSSSPFLSLW